MQGLIKISEDIQHENDTDDMYNPPQNTVGDDSVSSPAQQLKRKLDDTIEELQKMKHKCRASK